MYLNVLVWDMCQLSSEEKHLKQYYVTSYGL